ncbi:hypothetical protein B0T11DRAFT_305007 [Plectosphaerella cucumerina]|uniref:SMP-30/Gluconolactonase/LRE-like region domain-containing protein n=1 Tax=Plectosphaerella cucumerina TaxID=40658 RepID=A0A8K0X7S2_9PEZI|nr:hypothetical protein B0T11DRAFT_305007 [Plectosphaerella cucumerina]
MTSSALILAVSVAIGVSPWTALAQGSPAVRPLPKNAQIIDQRSFNVLEEVKPPLEANATTEFLWPGVTRESLREKPFHVYDPEFYDVIGSDPSLTLIAESDFDPIFHEAVTWYPPTDEMFFVQNAGNPDAGTGLNKSSIVQKISLADAEALRKGNFSAEHVTVHTVPSNPQVINPNGAANYKGQIIFAGEGQGDRIESALFLMNPVEPYNTTKLVNNFFGRQFNSLNDVAVNPRNMEIYFTDTLYGYYQYFRPAPGLQNQVYRLNPETGGLTVVADGFTLPNGIAFSVDGSYAYVTDTGISRALFGMNLTQPASIYRYDVQEDGTWENRKTFAYINARAPDGIHVDTKGNVYAGCGDGVHVWNPSGKLIGKIYTGIVAANFQFASNGRMIIMGRTKLWYATIAATGREADL